MVKSGWVGKIIYIIVILSSISICLIGIRSKANQEQQRKVEYAKSTIKSEAVKIKRLNKQIRQLYQNDQEEFLVEPIEKAKIKDIERDIIILKTEAVDFGLKSKDFLTDNSEVWQGKKELLLKIEEIKNKSGVQKRVSDLLVQAPTDWTTENLDVVIKENTTAEDIIKIRNDVSKMKDQWSEAITSVLDQMDVQVKQYNEIKQSIAEMNRDGVLTSEANMENFIFIFNQLSEIKNETLKKELSDQLDVIDKLLEKQAIDGSATEQDEVQPNE